MELTLGVSHNRNNSGSSSVCYLHLLQSGCKDKHELKCCTAHQDCGSICFACVVSKNPNSPNLSPMTDDTITQGGIRGLGFPLYICGPARATASLSVSGGQELHFPNFSLNFHQFFLIFPQSFPIFCPPGGRVAHLRKPWLHHWGLP